jgi:hypothetical protein
VADLLCLPVAPRWVVFVTSLFAKTAYRYREYAYRLCCQEGGMVTGALLAAAAEAGRAARAYTEFLDGPAAALLGTDPGAGALLAAVAIDPGRPGGTGGTTGAQGPAGRLDTSGHAGGSDWARVGELDRAGWHEGPGAVHAARNAVPARPGRVRRTSLGDVLAADRLATALLSRESGAPDFLASPRPLPAAVLAGVVRALDGTWPGDRLTADRLLSGRIVLQRSGELPPGTYVAAGGRLVPVRTGPLGVAYQAAVRSMNINPCAVAAGVYVCADCEAYLCAHGDRGYRLMHLDAGVLAEWVRLAAAAHGLVARVSNGYDTARMRALLGLTDVSSRPLFQVFLGAGAYGARYRFPLSG